MDRSLISALGSILLNQIRIYMRGLLFLPLPPSVGSLFLAFAAVSQSACHLIISGIGKGGRWENEVSH